MTTTPILLPPGPFDVILADPPWTFATYSVKGKGRSAERHYPCMPLADIKALPVAAIAASSCALYLWTTVPHLANAIGVISAWGFTYKSQFVWRKNRQATGYWAANQHEMLLIAARGGRIAPRFRGIRLASSVIDAPVRQHSRKPDEARRIIEAYHPDARRIELFARERSPGWTVFGNETDKF